MIDSPARALALGAVGLTLFAVVSVLYTVSNVAGSPGLLLAVAGVSALAGAVVGRFVRPAVALVLTLALLAAGGYGYLQTLPEGLALLGVLAPVLQDTVALLTGLSVLQIVNAGAWALAITPAPVFIVSYLAVRRHYGGAALAAGTTLGFFVLTGDASVPVTLLGVVGAAGAIGFGDLDRRPGRGTGAELVTLVLGCMVVLTLTVAVVPAGIGGVAPAGVGGETTVEASLVDTGETVAIQGPIELSPKVRFAVTSDEARYWRVGAFDRYTGSGWVRTGGTTRYDGPLAGDPGESRVVRQTYRAESRLDIAPAAWKPHEVDSGPPMLVTAMGGLRPTDPISPGESYTVESQVPVRLRADLADAGTDYPANVRDRYTRLPASTPDRVGEFTGRLTARAGNPYETAVVIERWLESNRRYSLDVSRPEGDVAAAFLFEMEAGYCTYFATTMVAMLRSQGIPARFVVGYTPGERVAADRWVVRGLDSHAWVEVYFPGTGWVRFDPTPAGPRAAAERERLATARANDVENVDTSQSGPGGWTPTPEPGTPETPTPTDGPPGRATPPGGVPGVTPTVPETTPGGGGPSGTGEGGFPDLPTRERIALGIVVLAGAAAGVRRSGLAGWAYRELRLRYQPRRSPERDVERAFARLEELLARTGHDRQAGDTPRQFLAGVTDERADRVGELYERARYAGRVTERDADEAVELVDELVREHPLPGRLRGR